MKDLSIYCVDVGSFRRKKFAWACSETMSDGPSELSSDIAALASAVVSDLDRGRPVALGFECPVWVPCPDSSSELSKARKGEGNRAWLAGAGATSLTIGLSQYPWVLREIARSGCKPEVFLDWKFFREADGGLLLWEAFVSGHGKKAKVKEADSHFEDAVTGIEALQDRLPSPESDLHTDEDPAFSIIAAAAIWAGLTNDKKLLSNPGLVIRA